MEVNYSSHHFPATYVNPHFKIPAMSTPDETTQCTDLLPHARFDAALDDFFWRQKWRVDCVVKEPSLTNQGASATSVPHAQGKRKPNLSQQEMDGMLKY
jgi:hypothetical protein